MMSCVVPVSRIFFVLMRVHTGIDGSILYLNCRIVYMYKRHISRIHKARSSPMPLRHRSDWYLNMKKLIHLGLF